MVHSPRPDQNQSPRPPHQPVSYGPPVHQPPPQPSSAGNVRPGSSHPLSPARDEVTRLLSAAAHVDADFSALAIREFLSEPLRAIAPSPGVDAAAVVREAVAARTRRRWRDGVIALLLIAVAACSPALLGAWVFWGAMWNLFGPRRRRLDGVRRPRMSNRSLVFALVVAVAAGAAGALSALDRQTQQLELGTAEPATSGSGLAVRTALAVLAALVIAAILFTDRILVWSLLTSSFRRGRFSPRPGSGDHLRKLGTSGKVGDQLARLAGSQARNVVVYLGDKPFVGWGGRLPTWSITVPLQPAGGDEKVGTVGAGGTKTGSPSEDGLPAAFPLSELYDHIGANLARLRESSPALSPSYRLNELQEFETLFVPAADLVTHFDDPAARFVLSRPDRPPALRVDPARVHEIAERPLEWMRYYRGFQVEAWDRDLVVSLFVHLGSDRDMLYFECTPCVLPPIYSSYRAIDLLSKDSRVAPILDALGSLITLPTSIVSRLAHAFQPSQGGGEGGPEYRASRYGASFSLRELAAQGNLHDYLKSRDVDRYLTLMQDQIFKATAEFLRSRGISSARFEATARIIQNAEYNNMFNQQGSTFNNSAFGTNTLHGPAGSAAGTAAGVGSEGRS